jgi:hypothetical protein
MASALREDNKNRDSRREQRRAEADTALSVTSILMIEVIRTQNTLFGLGLSDEVQSTQDAMVTVWRASSDARKARR